MLAFGFDNYLYVGVGDGGSAKTTHPNNAQNTSVLLGKIIRINVDQPDPIAGTRIPRRPTIPFCQQGAGRRLRLSACGIHGDSASTALTGQQWVGDVGQGAREEVDTPIVKRRQLRLARL